MNRNGSITLSGGCTCGALRYHMSNPPLFVHCCHCTWCQRETGSAFVINALIEADRVKSEGEALVVPTPSESGRGQNITRCPQCRVALWSSYSGLGEAVRFVRVGTLDPPARLAPDIHIYTMSKQPWVVLPTDTPAVSGYYDRKEYWSAASLERYRALRAGHTD